MIYSFSSEQEYQQKWCYYLPYNIQFHVIIFVYCSMSMWQAIPQIVEINMIDSELQQAVGTTSKSQIIQLV
jgi:hypothetical protein